MGSGVTADEVSAVTVVSSEIVYGRIVWDIRREVFEYGDAEPVDTITREYVDHTGAGDPSPSMTGIGAADPPVSPRHRNTGNGDSAGPCPTSTYYR
jgi:hypothetical protein